MNGVEVVLRNVGQLRHLYTRLRELRWEVDGMALLRTKNLFHKAVGWKEYRDVKCWLAVLAPEDKPTEDKPAEDKPAEARPPEPPPRPSVPRFSKRRRLAGMLTRGLKGLLGR